MPLCVVGPWCNGRVQGFGARRDSRDVTENGIGFGGGRTRDGDGTGTEPGARRRDQVLGTEKRTDCCVRRKDRRGRRAPLNTKRATPMTNPSTRQIPIRNPTSEPNGKPRNPNNTSAHCQHITDYQSTPCHHTKSSVHTRALRKGRGIRGSCFLQTLHLQRPMRERG